MGQFRAEMLELSVFPDLGREHVTAEVEAVDGGLTLLPSPTVRRASIPPERSTANCELSQSLVVRLPGGIDLGRG